MQIAILFPDIPADAALEDQDTLIQAEAIGASLGRLGHEVRTVSCTLDLGRLRQDLESDRPDVVFNLVESLGGTDAFIHFVPGLLDRLRIPYTGNRTEAIFRTTQKVVAKQAMHFAGIPTAPWYDPVMGDSSELAAWSRSRVLHATGNGNTVEPLTAPCIVKSNWEHASAGMDERNVLQSGSHEQVRTQVAAFQASAGRPFFAERYIDGREFNVAMIQEPHGVRILPPREIEYHDYPADKPRIFCHKAKWIEESFEYDKTEHTFDFEGQDEPLLDELCQLADDCWRLFSLSGYARIDSRVDRDGRPWILEVTCNPCLGPESGFAASLKRAGIGYDEAIGWLVDAARRGGVCQTEQTAGSPA